MFTQKREQKVLFSVYP